MIDLQNIKSHNISRPGVWTLFGSPEDFDNFPQEHKDQILFLDKPAGKYIYGFAASADLVSDDTSDPFHKNNFKTIEEFKELADESKLKKWLYRRRIPFGNWVFVLPAYNDYPIYTTWKMIIKYNSTILFSSDVLIFDNTLNWCLFYFHHDHLFFARDNIYDPTDKYKKMEQLNELKGKYPNFKFPY